jgi:hypothetical protein
VLGAWFKIGDQSMGGFAACDPLNCHDLDRIRVLDFAGYGSIHPGLFTVEFEVYCCDELGCPVGPAVWNSGPYETGFGWNYVTVDPPISVCGCATTQDPPTASRILVTTTHTGPHGQYPAWGFDNIGTAVETGCQMTDEGGMDALYPRPYTSHYETMHSGFYGRSFAYCPPEWFLDKSDTTPDGSDLGYVELAWRVYVTCSGPTGVESASWGQIKTIYR